MENQVTHIGVADIEEFSKKALVSKAMSIINAEHFDVCAVDNLAYKLSEVRKVEKLPELNFDETSVYPGFCVLHCKDYSAMDDSVRTGIPDAILRALGISELTGPIFFGAEGWKSVKRHYDAKFNTNAQNVESDSINKAPEISIISNKITRIFAGLLPVSSKKNKLDTTTAEAQNHSLPSKFLTVRMKNQKIDHNQANQAVAFEKEFKIVDYLYKAFETRGGCSGNDISYSGLFAILSEWEKIRTPEAVKALERLCTPSIDVDKVNGSDPLVVEPSKPRMSP